ncbi:hypothetical protein SB776_37190, partial [Burkholderia sp. SIMBA_045]
LRNELIQLNAEITATDLTASKTLTSAIISLETTALNETLEALDILSAGEKNPPTRIAIESYTEIARKLISLCTDKLDEVQAELSHAIY